MNAKEIHEAVFSLLTELEEDGVDYGKVSIYPTRTSSIYYAIVEFSTWYADALNGNADDGENAAYVGISDLLEDVETRRSDGFVYTSGMYRGVSVKISSSREVVCEQVEVGEKIIPAEPETIIPAKPERVEKQYEWRCKDPIVAAMAKGEL